MGLRRSIAATVESESSGEYSKREEGKGKEGGGGERRVKRTDLYVYSAIFFSVAKTKGHADIEKERSKEERT